MRRPPVCRARTPVIRLSRKAQACLVQERAPLTMTKRGIARTCGGARKTRRIRGSEEMLKAKVLLLSTRLCVGAAFGLGSIACVTSRLVPLVRSPQLGDLGSAG